MNSEPRIVSFVIRFVYEEPTDEPARKAVDWYSVIRHVQSDTERRFSSWPEIVSFIERYVDLSEEARND